jgi:hypothetical protein
MVRGYNIVRFLSRSVVSIDLLLKCLAPKPLFFFFCHAGDAFGSKINSSWVRCHGKVRIGKC